MIQTSWWLENYIVKCLGPSIPNWTVRTSETISRIRRPPWTLLQLEAEEALQDCCSPTRRIKELFGCAVHAFFPSFSLGHAGKYWGTSTWWNSVDAAFRVERSVSSNEGPKGKLTLDSCQALTMQHKHFRKHCRDYEDGQTLEGKCQKYATSMKYIFE